MNAIRIRKTVDEHTVESLPELKVFAGRTVDIFVVAETAPAQPAASDPLPPRKGFGAMRGKIHMADDFDAPLEDFREYME